MCDESNKEWCSFLCLDNQLLLLIISALDSHKIHKSVETRNKVYHSILQRQVQSTGGMTAAAARWLAKVSVDGGRVLTRLSAGSSRL